MASSSQPSVWATLSKLLLAMTAAGVLAAGFLLPYVGGIGLAAGHEADKFLDTSCNLVESTPPLPTNIYARDGKTLIARIFEQDRVPVSLDKVPQALQDALVATEDRRFFSHHGVDMRGLIRSAVANSGGDTQGGSTLTMQYVKQMRYYQAGNDKDKQDAAVAQNLTRKIEDAKCALYLENTKKESKQQILENYLNIAFFGENSYGVQTAAQTYFGKNVQDLTLPESALLVGVLRAPTLYDPFLSTNAAAAKERRNQVIQNLVDVGKLDQASADKYKATPVALSTDSSPPVREGCTNSGSRIPNVGFFCDYVTSWLDTVGGITDTQLRTGGLNIVTTLDPAIQASTQKGITGAVANTSPMTAVLPVLDPRNGDVLAMATSKNYGIPTSDKDHTHTTLPVFTSYTGYGASTYKLFPLLTALSTGIPSDWKLQQPVNNDPYLPRNCATDAKTFNDDSKVAFWNRNETLQDATVKSSNTYFVALADQGFGCDLQPIINIAKKLGLKGLTQPSTEPKLTIEQTIVDYQRVNQLVLGDVPTSPLEIAGAYAAVANGGVFNAPAPVLSIKDSNGDPLTVKRSAGVRAVPEQIALQAVQILTGDTKAPGTSADAFSGWYGRNGSLVAGKTGTSVAVVNGKDTKENASLWFVGLTPKLVAATALVNFDNPHNPAAGLKGLRHPGTEAYGEYASRVWLKSLSATLKGDDWTWASPGSADGDDVPDIVGDDMDEAKAKLSDAGFKMALVDPDPANKVYCPSSQPYGKVAYYGPQKAQQGDTVTVCPSLGQPQQIYVPPKPTPKPKPTKKPTKTTSPTGATSTAPATGGGGGGGGNGRGRQSPH